VPEIALEVKGTPVIASRDWLDERLGAGWFYETISAEYPSWPKRVLPGEFYPLRPQVHAFQRALGRIDGHNDVELMVQQAAALTAERDLNSIYKAFLWAASPQLFLRAVPRLWSMYVSFGQLTTTENRSGLYQAQLTQIPEDLLDWSAGALAGFLRPALLLAGGSSPDSQITARRPSTADLWDLEYRLAYSTGA
jgi:hypothetical protein